MGFWEDVDQALAAARDAKTADELIAGLNTWHEPSCADAFFGGSGGDNQLHEALDRAHWRIHYIDGHIHWRAVSTVDGSSIEYVEGDIYKR